MSSSGEPEAIARSSSRMTTSPSPRTTTSTSEVSSTFSSQYVGCRPPATMMGRGTAWAMCWIRGRAVNHVIEFAEMQTTRCLLTRAWNALRFRQDRQYSTGSTIVHGKPALSTTAASVYKAHDGMVVSSCMMPFGHMMKPGAAVNITLKSSVMNRVLLKGSPRVTVEGQGAGCVPHESSRGVRRDDVSLVRSEEDGIDLVREIHPEIAEELRAIGPDAPEQTPVPEDPDRSGELLRGYFSNRLDLIPGHEDRADHPVDDDPFGMDKKGSWSIEITGQRDSSNAEDPDADKRGGERLEERSPRRAGTGPVSQKKSPECREGNENEEGDGDDRDRPSRDEVVADRAHQVTKLPHSNLRSSESL